MDRLSCCAFSSLFVVHLFYSFFTFPMPSPPSYLLSPLHLFLALLLSLHLSFYPICGPPVQGRLVVFPSWIYLNLLGNKCFFVLAHLIDGECVCVCVFLCVCETLCGCVSVRSYSMGGFSTCIGFACFNLNFLSLHSILRTPSNIREDQHHLYGTWYSRLTQMRYANNLQFAIMPKTTNYKFHRNYFRGT